MATAVASPVSTVSSSRLRAAGWLLITTIVVAVLYLVAAGLTFPAELERSSQLTPDQMADIRVGWVVASLLWAVPLILAAVAFHLVGVSTPARILAAVGAAGYVAYFVVTASEVGFTAERLGLDGRHDVATQLSIYSAWVGYLATVLFGVALFGTRVLRKTGIIVAVITALYLALDVVTFLPGLTGEIELDEVENLPPVVITLLWLALGIALVRRRVASRS